MRLVSTTTNPKLSLGILLFLVSFSTFAQENSPFSRYGLGDLFSGQNIVNRGLGGLSSPYVDGQSINFYNPASYSAHRFVTFDVGINIDNRNLKSASPVKKFSSTNFTPSYVSLGMPLNKAKNLGIAFGIRPISKINYAIQERKRVAGIDSFATLYEGNGGLYQLFAGVGKRWGGFSIGFNTGYSFGRRETNTRVVPLNDTVFYYESNSRTTTTYGKAFFNSGMQYRFGVSKNSAMTLGFTTALKQTFDARQDVVRETYSFTSGRADTARVTVSESLNNRGTIEVPSTYTAGLSYSTTITDRFGGTIQKGMLGVEFESAKWSQFKFYNQPDKLTDSWQFRLAGQFIPNPLSTSSYWNMVTFRAGFYTGKDYVNADGKELKVNGLTLGAGLPIRNWRGYGSTQSTVLNTAIEVGKRGSKANNITENYFRISFGMALSDFGWFQKRRYD
ncbi:MAG TPA: hypothetical protein VF622_15835 [Segetibacter sp.]|jgi:hypothetical protein